MWKMTTKKGVVCEEWKKMNKSYLQNKGYMVNGRDTIINERVALTRNGEVVFYTSTVEDQNNKQSIAFKTTSASSNTFVFENKEHDFPKRIVYQLISADSLHAFIDDGLQYSLQIQHFNYTRQKN
ncbi:MAG: DUF6265 family protein [Chitinophagaceae bacterium]